jgi:hypothetical protein
VSELAADRSALIGSAGGQPPADERRRRGAGKQPAPPPEFRSYYGRSVLKPPVWEPRDIAGYLFLGGLAGASALVGAGGDLTGRPALRRTGRAAALGGVTLSFAALVHDLGRPGRFLNMLRVAKPTSPMSMGTWILSAFGPAAGVAAVAEVVDRLPLPSSARELTKRAERPAGLASAAVAPLVMTYTAALISDTAVPTWHGAFRQMPYLFAASSFAAAGGLATAVVPPIESGPAQVLALGGALADVAVERLMHRRLGTAAEPLERGRAGRLMRLARWGNLAGAALIASGRDRDRLPLAVGGSLLVAASACTRFGVFEAGVESSRDPRYTVLPQRARQSATDGSAADDTATHGRAADSTATVARA